ncbi:MAG: ribosome biogenesis GTPase Der, partial [Thiobacillus sp.]
GLTPQDKLIADRLRRASCPVLLAVNKAEGMNAAVITAEFHELALGQPLAISSAHGDGVSDLVAEALAPFSDEEEKRDDFGIPKIALVGRPNVGKSTLVNTLVGEERVIAFDQPGTTRDSIYVEFERDGKPYILIDTAGLRRRGKVFETVEKFSVIKTLQAIEDANVVVLVLDARENISEQDAHLAGFVLETGRALVVAVNKWDGLSAEQRDDVKRDIGRKLAFLDFARFNYISALKGKGLENLLKDVEAAHAAAFIKLSTPKLTRVLEMAVEQHAPPKNGLFRPKPRYAHQGGKNPPVIILHGNALEGLRDDYKRYLESSFRKAFKLQGTPLRIQIKEGGASNPYQGKTRGPMTESEATRMRRKKRVRRKVYGKD